MTVVNLRGLHTALGVPAVTSGVVMVEYWAGSSPVARVDGADVVFPALITAAIVEGDPGTLDLVPTRGVCCVKWTIQSDRSAVSVVRFTEIPETGPVAFGALQQVDPATFVPTEDVVAAWEAAIDDVAALRDQAAGSASAAAGSASTASTSATSAAGSAAAAGGSATAAGGSASAAAGSASTASTGAATATSKAGAASSSADAAAASATAASGSASAAAGSASAAAQSKTDADTARTAAQNAQAGAETARTGAEAARDLALAGQFAGANLQTSTDLNTVTTPGVYRQITATDLRALNYPDISSLGILRVYTTTNTVLQEFVPLTNGAQAARGTYMRRMIVSSGVWTSWTLAPTQRVDQTAGRAIYIWDALNNREQLIYGDTGWRDITTLATNGWTFTQLRLRRFGPRCTLVIVGPNGVGSTGTQFALVDNAAFRSAISQTNVFALADTTNPRELRVLNSGSTAIGFEFPIAWSSGRSFSAEWYTDAAWPSSLPGTAIGAIPNT